MKKDQKFISGEYSPTPSHCLPSFVGGEPKGFMCIKCGYIVKELDPIFEDLCLVCLRDWALKSGVSRLIPTKEALEKVALEPTEKIAKGRQEATTKIMNLNNATKTDYGGGYKRIDRSNSALEKNNPEKDKPDQG